MTMNSHVHFDDNCLSEIRLYNYEIERNHDCKKMLWYSVSSPYLFPSTSNLGVVYCLETDHLLIAAANFFHLLQPTELKLFITLESEKENEPDDQVVDHLSFVCACRKRVRKAFVNSILEQQAQNLSLGVSDPKGLLAHSRANSKEARLRARQCAMANAKEVYEGVGGVDYSIDSSFRRKNRKLTSSLSPLISRTKRPRGVVPDSQGHNADGSCQ